MKVSVVGVCGSGKSVLVRRLREHAYDAREIAQEHSFVPGMWRRLHAPGILIFLDAQLATVRARRPGTLLSDDLYRDMQDRLEDARAHAALVIVTDDLTESGVVDNALEFLLSIGAPAEE